MYYYERAKKLNDLANKAVSVGDLALAYKLKIMAAKNTLYCYEQTGDQRWVKVASTLFNDAKPLKEKLLSPKIEVNIKSGRRIQNSLEDNDIDFVVKPMVSLKNIGGLETSKRLLREAIEWPLKFPEKMNIFQSK